MNPFSASRGSNRAPFVLVLTLLIALFFVTGCGSGGDDDEEEPSNKWDEMKWDEGKWGAVQPHTHRIVIA